MYDKPNRLTYILPAADIGAGNKTLKIVGPKGKEGRVYDYGVLNVTEAFTATTTAATIAVGSNSDPDAYGEELTMGTTAAGGGKTLRSTFNSASDLEDYLVGTIPADGVVVVTATAPTGGTPAGIGDVYAIIDWAW